MRGAEEATAHAVLQLLMQGAGLKAGIQRCMLIAGSVGTAVWLKDKSCFCSSTPVSPGPC